MPLPLFQPVRAVCHQLLDAFAPRRKQPYTIYAAAGLGTVRDAIGVSAFDLAQNLLRGVTPLPVTHCLSPVCAEVPSVLGIAHVLTHCVRGCAV